MVPDSSVVMDDDDRISMSDLIDNVSSRAALGVWGAVHVLVLEARIRGTVRCVWVQWVQMGLRTEKGLKNYYGYTSMMDRSLLIGKLRKCFGQIKSWILSLACLF